MLSVRVCVYVSLHALGVNPFTVHINPLLKQQIHANKRGNCATRERH